MVGGTVVVGGTIVVGAAVTTASVVGVDACVVDGASVEGAPVVAMDDGGSPPAVDAESLLQPDAASTNTKARTVGRNSMGGSLTSSSPLWGVERHHSCPAPGPLPHNLQPTH